MLLACSQFVALTRTPFLDSTIAVWDLRNMSKPLSELLGHTDQVFKVEWSPLNESILGSCSADRRVALWDLSRIGQEQSPEDAEDGPPELLFLHGGHTSNVSDFSWNTKDEWTLVSVSEDNVLQVWKPAEEIYAEDDDDDENKEDETGDAGKGKGTVGDDDLE
jgi:histone-binding protein RBBP4